MIDDDIFLRDLPADVWTESDMGQSLLQLAREGKCKYIRLNATLGRFEPLQTKGETTMTEYQPRTAGRLAEILRAQDQNPRSWQQEAAAAILSAEELRKYVLAYLSEHDNPVADYNHRRAIRNHIRVLVGAPDEPKPRGGEYTKA